MEENVSRAIGALAESIADGYDEERLSVLGRQLARRCWGPSEDDRIVAAFDALMASGEPRRGVAEKIKKRYGIRMGVRQINNVINRLRPIEEFSMA